MIHLICCVIPFGKNPIIDLIQMNSLLSWKHQKIINKIIVVGEQGDLTKNICDKNGFIYNKHIDKSPYGTPLLPSIFKEGMKSEGNII